MTPRVSCSFAACVPVLCLAPSTSAQVRESWVARHDGAPSQSDYANAVALDGAGNVIVTGRSFNPTVGSPPAPPTQDIETVCYAPDGTPTWSARYQGPLAGDDVGQAVCATSAGDVFVAGYSAGYSGGYVTEQTVLRYAPDGTLAWARQFGNVAGPNNARAILVDGSGSVFVGGTEGGAGTGDMVVRKLDSAGNELWAATHDGATQGFDVVYQIAIAQNGDVVAVGNVGIVNTNFADLCVMRVSPSGAVLWAREIDGGANLYDTAFSVALDGAGNAFVAGYATTLAAGQNGWLLAYDPAGNLLWSRAFDGSAHGNDVWREVALDPFGRVVVAGGTTNPGAGTDFALHVIDASGNTVWQRAWDGAAHLDDTARGLSIDALGNVHVAGYRTASTTPTTDVDAVAIEYDPSGALRYEYVHAGLVPGSTSERLVDVRAAPSGAILLTGYADMALNNTNDFLTIQLERTAVPYCFGDGGGAACPCGNSGASIDQAGCLNSLGSGGRLADVGASSLSADSLGLLGTGMPSSSALYFQGTAQQAGGVGTAFGDGLRCASGTIVRLATKTNVGGASQYPALGDLPVSVRGGVASPGTRTYQVWYRNAAAYCTSATFNLSNGLRVAWIP